MRQVRVNFRLFLTLVAQPLRLQPDTLALNVQFFPFREQTPSSASLAGARGNEPLGPSVAFWHLWRGFEAKSRRCVVLAPFPAGFFMGRLSLSFPVVAVRSSSFLETVFGFSVIVSPFLPVVAGGGGPPGRVWEGATAPLPIERDVSEANSFVAPQHSYPQPESYPQARRFRLSDFRYMQDIRI